MRWFFLLACFSLCAKIPDKLLICGIARNVEAAVPNTIRSAEHLGAQFQDYRIIIYENNSTDQTKSLFSKWAEQNRKVIFLSEKISNSKLIQDSKMKVKNRTEVLARARNIVLDRAMAPEFEEYKYVVWADLDFLEPWDVDELVETVLHPKQEWDAVFSYGGYDLFALRTEEWPIGFELIGAAYWSKLDLLREVFVLNEESPWKKVYSAFGGLAIYKREALKDCNYSGVITADLENIVEEWLKKAKKGEKACFLQEYEHLVKTAQTLELKTATLEKRSKYPEELGVKLKNGLGKGNIVWFSCTPKTTLPWTCEHIPLHASMILKGRDRLFVNPKLRSNHP